MIDPHDFSIEELERICRERGYYLHPIRTIDPDLHDRRLRARVAKMILKDRGLPTTQAIATAGRCYGFVVYNQAHDAVHAKTAREEWSNMDHEEQQQLRTEVRAELDAFLLENPPDTDS